MVGGADKKGADKTTSGCASETSASTSVTALATPAHTPTGSCSKPTTAPAAPALDKVPLNGTQEAKDLDRSDKENLSGMNAGEQQEFTINVEVFRETNVGKKSGTTPKVVNQRVQVSVWKTDKLVLQPQSSTDKNFRSAFDELTGVLLLALMIVFEVEAFL